jgi:hypothetical protein
MKVVAILVWLSFTVSALFALLSLAHERSPVLRPIPELTGLDAARQNPERQRKWHKPRVRLADVGNASEQVTSSAEADSESTEEDIYLRVVRLAGEKNHKALAECLLTAGGVSLQRFIVQNIEPDCETCLNALVWALTSSFVYQDAANKLRGKVLFSVRERLFASLLENEDSRTAERRGNASAIISLLSEANDDREREMMVALASSNLSPFLRAQALKCIDPPFTDEVKDALIAAVSAKESDAFGNIVGIAALAKIRESPFAEAVPVLAQIAIHYSERCVRIDEDSGAVYYVRTYPDHYMDNLLAALGKRAIYITQIPPTDWGE